MINGDITNFINESVSKYEHAKKRFKEERISLKNAIKRAQHALKAQEIAQIVAASVQESAHKQISAIVSRCLTAVFGENAYQFKIKFEKKRGQTEAQLVFIRDKLELNPVDSCGGGVIDVAAFALRLACLILQKPKRRRILILDEPFRFVSERKEYRERVRELLELLAKEMNVQIIMVTHSKELEVGKVIELD